MKKLGIVLIILILMTGLIACGGNKLSNNFEESEITEKAHKAIQLFNERKYQDIIDMGDDNLKNAITAEEFAEQSDPYLDKCKELESFDKEVIVGQQDKKSGKDYGVIVVVGKYEEGKIQFTIAFDKDMNLVQFVIK